MSHGSVHIILYFERIFTAAVPYNKDMNWCQLCPKVSRPITDWVLSFCR